MRRATTFAVAAVLLAQLIAAGRVALRLAHTGRGDRIQRSSSTSQAGSVAVIVPVLNEEQRLGPCLAGLTLQGDEVGEILVVDGGSADGTREVVLEWAARDARMRYVDASPTPPGWNGKPWGLHVGTEAVSRGAEWVLTIDADVRPGEGLVPSLLAHAHDKHLRVLSVATPQRVSGLMEAIVHSSLLASLVYRYGIPGHAYENADSVQANGQCFLIHRQALADAGGFTAVGQSIVEDITLARRCVRAGIPVGFYEPDRSKALVTVEMYAGWYDALKNWSRSLPMRDRDAGVAWWLRMCDLVLVMGLPVVLVAVSLTWRTMPLRSLVRRLNAVLGMMRLGTQAGMSRAYVRVPAAHWAAVLIDPVTVAVIMVQASRRAHPWRGRIARW